MEEGVGKRCSECAPNPHAATRRKVTQATLWEYLSETRTPHKRDAATVQLPECKFLFGLHFLGSVVTVIVDCYLSYYISYRLTWTVGRSLVFKGTVTYAESKTLICCWWRGPKEERRGKKKKKKKKKKEKKTKKRKGGRGGSLFSRVKKIASEGRVRFKQRIIVLLPCSDKLSSLEPLEFSTIPH